MLKAPHRASTQRILWYKSFLSPLVFRFLPRTAKQSRRSLRSSRTMSYRNFHCFSIFFCLWPSFSYAAWECLRYSFIWLKGHWFISVSWCLLPLFFTCSRLRNSRGCFPLSSFADQSNETKGAIRLRLRFAERVSERERRREVKLELSSIVGAGLATNHQSDLLLETTRTDTREKRFFNLHHPWMWMCTWRRIKKSIARHDEWNAARETWWTWWCSLQLNSIKNASIMCDAVRMLVFAFRRLNDASGKSYEASFQ